MIPFIRKRKEDDEEEEVGTSKKLSKDNDIPKTRRKKKEPLKPWGKKERIILFIILLFTVVASGALALSAREWKLPGLPRIDVSKISIFRSEPIVIEKEGLEISEEKRQRAREIVNVFRDEVADLSGVYGLFVIDLDSGYSFGLNQKETFQAASLIKLPAIVAIYREAEKGSLDLEESYSLKAEDKVSGSGSLYLKPVGTTLSYRELVELMGKQSDNTAYRAVVNLLGEQKIEEVIVDLGMASTSFENNETTPEDIGYFFQGLYKSKFLSKENSDELLEFLTDTIYEAWITEGVPKEIQVSHKFGREVHVVNDAGVVFSKDPYVLVIMSKGAVEREADELIPIVSGKIYDMWLE